MQFTLEGNYDAVMSLLGGVLAINEIKSQTIEAIKRTPEQNPFKHILTNKRIFSNASTYKT